MSHGLSMTRLALFALLLVPLITHGQAPRLSDGQLARIGQRIWTNECDGTVAGLTSWNQGEDFASLGIGHFIWYPAGKEGPFEESFPKLVAYLQNRRTPLPAWLAAARDCPWPDRTSFIRDKAGQRQQDLRKLLAATVREQTEFIILRLQNALPQMLAAAPKSQRKNVQTSFSALIQTPEGAFAMIDYVNFKGEGTKPGERYQGEGWGLLQVLADMRPDPRTPAHHAFAAAAKRVLARRVQNAPPARNEQRWLAGWHNRCNGYLRPL